MSETYLIQEVDLDDNEHGDVDFSTLTTYEILELPDGRRVLLADITEHSDDGVLRITRTDDPNVDKIARYSLVKAAMNSGAEAVKLASQAAAVVTQDADVAKLIKILHAIMVEKEMAGEKS